MLGDGYDLLLHQHRAAHGAVLALRQAGLGAGGGHGRVDDLGVVLVLGDLRHHHIMAHGAVIALGQTRLVTGGGYGRIQLRHMITELNARQAPLAAAAVLLAIRGGVPHIQIGMTQRILNIGFVTAFALGAAIVVVALGGAGWLRRKGVNQRAAFRPGIDIHVIIAIVAGVAVLDGDRMGLIAVAVIDVAVIVIAGSDCPVKADGLPAAVILIMDA